MSSEVTTWYGDLYDEGTRLTDGSLEFVRSKEIIARYLGDDPLMIADVGGATGQYSFWLAAMGHHAHLVDLTPRHVEQAIARQEQTGVELSDAVCADARRLPFDDATFDLVLQMGPLYHLQQLDDRLSVLREAHRVLKPGCPVIGAVISRYASMMDGFKLSLVKDEYFAQIMQHDLATGCHDNPRHVPQYFTTAYFHRPDDIRDELEQAGFRDVQLIAVEGFATLLDGDAILTDETMSPALLDCLRQTETAPDLMGVSAHIMAVGWRP